MKHFTTILAILAAVVLTDTQWAVMQSITWTQMVLADERDDISLFTVIADTVTGKDLCTSCRFIERERNSDQEKTLTIISKMGIVAPISFSKYALSLPEGNTIAWANPGNHLPDDENPLPIDHPPQA